MDVLLTSQEPSQSALIFDGLTFASLPDQVLDRAGEGRFEVR